MFLRRSANGACSSLWHRRYATEATSGIIGKPSVYGQPLFQSHPHLIRPNELTPGIPSDEYEQRRRRLMENLPDNCMALSLSAPVKYMSGKIFYQYRQASDFWYLTGFDEPDSALILEKTSCARGYKMTLFSSGRDLDKERWDGARTSFEDVATIFCADEARSIELLLSHLRSIVGLYSHVYMDQPPASTISGIRSPTKQIFQRLSSPSFRHQDLDLFLESLKTSRRKPLAPEIASLRAIKSENEQRIMRTAADISAMSHAKTMRFACPGLPESSLAAHFEYLSRIAGAQRLAYVPVVASGPNALVIHYTSNNHLVRHGEMLLVDAGCEYNGYASDITRSYPASGSFTDPQRDLYSAVLATQKSLIALCAESSQISLHELHRKSCDFLRHELNQLGFSLQNGDLERVLYPHFLSHPIGIDIHESSNFDRNAYLTEGMVITIEPGVYVPPNASFPRQYHNLGIRIEDEVLVGKRHPTVLTINAPKEIPDVEGACQGSLGLEPF